MDDGRAIAPPKPYFLSRHVFLCLEDEYVFLLDLRQDKYFALDVTRSRGLGAWVNGWPIQADDVAACHAGGAAMARSLESRGVLCTDPTSGKQASTVNVQTATAQLWAEDFNPHGIDSRVGPAAVFVMTFLIGAIQFRCCSLERLIGWMSASRHARRRVERPFDDRRVLELLCVFRKLRPFLFTSRDGCLFESFVLVRFLMRYGWHPQWVFGIRASPFGAHCWVQHGSTVLNDTVEHVRRLTPIMVV